MLIAKVLLRSALILQLVQCDVYANVQVALVESGESSGERTEYMVFLYQSRAKAKYNQ
jgi:hypothetical protein